jgi:hypothetical protein
MCQSKIALATILIINNRLEWDKVCLEWDTFFKTVFYIWAIKNLMP